MWHKLAARDNELVRRLQPAEGAERLGRGNDYPAVLGYQVVLDDDKSDEGHES